MAFALLPPVVKSYFQVLMEHFDNPDQLQDAINCSGECANLLKFPAATSLSEYFPEHLLTSEETRRLGEAENHMMGLLEETKRAVSVVKEMRQRVKCRRERNMERTREVFDALRKVIDDQEKRVIRDIKKEADKREKALKVLLYSCNMAQD